jgi:two-component system chemotaxis response regulator CheY
LPDISGLSVLKCIHEADPDAKVVMLTANSSEKNIKEAINHGAKGFIAKPFTREKLFAYIYKLL